MAKYQDFLSRVGSNRDRAALRGIFSQFLTDDDPPALKDLTLASIVLSGAETTEITISGASTTGILQSGTSTTAYSITGAFTTGINIAADGTTGISITSAFSGVNAISLAGTGSTAGINISGDHTTAITIGAQTTGAIAITGATATGISITGACSTAALQMGVSGTTAGDFIWYGTTALYKVLFDADGDTNGAVFFGADTKGIQTTWYGDTTAYKVVWDPTADTNGSWRFGSDGKGVEVVLYGVVASYNVTWDPNGDTNGTLHVGADTFGLMFKLYGDTTGCGVFWDPSGDTNGALSIGASGGSKGNDLLAYGATNGNYMHWDQSANSLLLVGTSTVLNIAGTTASSSAATGALICAGGAGIGGAIYAGDSINMLNDKALTLGTTVATAATKITLEFDSTTGIGLFNMGSTSAPMVLATNPGSGVIGHTVNILHSAGAGDCEDLLGSYTKVAFSGDGDSGVTAVGGAFRAYVGTAVGDSTVVKELYGIQPWCSHDGTGAITAMSALSAKCDVNTGNFTATTVNAGHFHVEGAATVTSSMFDGVMIEIYPDVTCLDAGLRIVTDTGAVMTNGIAISGVMTNGLNLSATADVGILMTGATKGIDVTCSAIGATGRIAKLAGSIAAGALTDGYGAVEVDLTMTGTQADHVAALSAWVNIADAAITGGAGKFVCAQDNGLYASSPGEMANTKVIYGMRAQAVGMPADALIFPFSLNTGGAIGHKALFEINTTEEMSCAAGKSTESIFAPIFYDANGKTWYVELFA
jgi:hypothetical protein